MRIPALAPLALLGAAPAGEPALAAADAEGKKKYYADPEFRRAVKEKMAAVRASFRTSWEQSVISMCASNPEYEERTVADVARELGVETIDLGFDLALATNLEARFRMPVANADETVVEELLKNPNTVLGLSDAPNAGDDLLVVESERKAREVALCLLW